MPRLKIIPILFLLSAALAVSVNAQATPTILQVTVPFNTRDIVEPVLSEFATQYPNIQIQSVYYQGFGMPVANSDDAETYLDNLQTYFSSADVLIVNNSLTPEATRAGYVLDLAPMIRSDSTLNTSDFQPNVLASFEWDGGQWALPISTSFTVLTYLPEAFDAAGVAYPDANWTLSDLENAARALTQYNADGTISRPGLIVQGNASGLPALMLSLNGGGVYDDFALPSNPDYSSTVLADNLAQWAALSAEGLFTLPSDVNPNEIPIVIGNPQGFGRGGPFGEQGETDQATALLPGGYAGLNVTGYAVSHGTQYPQEAYELVKYLIQSANMLTVSNGIVPALQSLEGVDASTGFGPSGGGPGFGFNEVPAALEPLVDTALAQGMNPSTTRFSSGILTALNLITSEGIDASTALEEAQAAQITRLTTADARAAEPITVQAPKETVVLSPDEVALKFAVLGGAGRGGGLSLQEQWQAIADEYAELDPTIGAITIEAQNQNEISTVTESYDCFYANSNLVPSLDTSLLLSLDPLISTDFSFDDQDFIAGVLDQVRADNMLWALPLHITPLVLRYDAAMFEAAGVALPQNNWTVSDFENTLRQLKDALGTDEASLQLNAGGQTSLLALIAIYGGLPVDFRTDPATLNFADPASVAAIQQVLDLAANGYITYSRGFGGANTGQTDYPLYSNLAGLGGFGGPGGFGGGPGGGGQNTTNTDGMVTFPLGVEYSVVPFELGTAYITAATTHATECYNFISYVAQSPTLFNSMPPRYSLINNSDFLAAQGESNIATYQALADLMAQPTTLTFSSNINAGNFGLTNWLFDVFDAYLAGTVVDLAADLQAAQNDTQAFNECVAAIPTENATPGVPDPSFFEQVQACQSAVNEGG